ncbi:MAG: hypothetical protein V3W18_07880 [candidate division Zixibacteria bacterium]
MDSNVMPELDRMKLNRYLEEVKANQNLILGITGGFIAAIIGAVIWGVITYATGYQIGFMAVGVGFIVGYSVRQFGKGVDIIFGISGASLSLIGCLLGNLFTSCIVISKQAEIGLLSVVGGLNLEIIIGILSETFRPMDLLFYAIAIYEGYKISFLRLSQEEIGPLLKG